MTDFNAIFVTVYSTSYYYRALSIAKDEDLELHLKRQPNSSIVNNYFDVSF